ncbi:nuclear transport factor 2 family protein [Chryseolinea lacunae]|uniref:Nuclear transport factor 2 family protein n=1 Tax=Chryseolinea lacunae TaxID=2801331 RepID=A0ABS1KU59_9BACT|nr:nuclear transport factor 2 family protein [Chryseolinea lacunae]MBL0742944.1 nuclear transport factor 2 family protein [Chryseolinea lacunae]
MNSKTTTLLLFTLAAAIFACAPKKTETSDSNHDEATRSVLEHHWKSFQDRDIDGLMSDYTDESILITPDRTYKGLAEIRDNYIKAFAVFPKDSTTMKITKTIVQDDLGYILWEATVPKFKLPYATDTFIIRNGKIARQTFAGAPDFL